MIAGNNFFILCCSERMRGGGRVPSSGHEIIDIVTKTLPGSLDTAPIICLTPSYCFQNRLSPVLSDKRLH